MANRLRVANDRIAELEEELAKCRAVCLDELSQDRQLMERNKLQAEAIMSFSNQINKLERQNYYLKEEVINLKYALAQARQQLEGEDR